MTNRVKRLLSEEEYCIAFLELIECDEIRTHSGVCYDVLDDERTCVIWMTNRVGTENVLLELHVVHD